MAAQSEYLINIKVIDGKAQANIKGLTKGFESLDGALKKIKISSTGTAKATEDLGKKNLDLMSKAGLAGATLTEVGRTISDLPYGIRGVANNLSQLSTLFVTLISTTGSFKNAMTLLKKQLSGPLGIILAFQAVLAALDFFVGSTKKAKEETDSLTESIEKQTSKINSLAYAEDQLNLKRTKRGTVERARMAESGKTLRETISILRHEFSEFDKYFDSLGDKSDEAVNDLIKDFRRLLQLRAGQANLEKELIEANKDYDELGFATSQEERVEAQRRIILSQRALRKSILEQIEIEGRYNVQIDGNSKKLKDYSDNVKELKASMDFSELNLEEGLMELDAFDMALNERIAFMGQFLVESSEQRIDRLEKEALEYLRILDEELELVELNEKDKQKIRDYYNSLRQKDEGRFIDDLIASIQQVASAFSAATQAAFEADMSIEERRTVMANNHLKERLKNEKLSASERERINQQIAANEESLQQKRDEIAERQFQNEKAAAIAAALVNTYLAATDVLAREKLGLVGKTLAAAAIIGFGLAQVAAIARQRFVPSAVGGAGVGGAGGAGATIEAPDFNVVGASSQNQLAETIAGAEAKPTRAYVVGKDITTQQELDRNITNTASFG